VTGARSRGEISRQSRLANELSKGRHSFCRSQRGGFARREDVAGIERRTGAGFWRRAGEEKEKESRWEDGNQGWLWGSAPWTGC
jgi:hypothetical protein